MTRHNPYHPLSFTPIRTVDEKIIGTSCCQYTIGCPKKLNLRSKPGRHGMWVRSEKCVI